MLETLDYPLSPDEIELAETVGRNRCNAKDTSIRFHDSGYHDYSPDRALPHIIGVKAEIAYAALTNQELDLSLFKLRGDNTDFNQIELKASTWDGDDIELKVKVKEYIRKKPLVYILARVKPALVQFIGAINRKRFDEIKYLRQHKYVDNYCVMGSSLSKCLPYFRNGEFIKNDF